ncbi:MAG: AAA family ATPase [Thermoguttaceae bacterium]
MLTRVEIKNYRCFESYEMQDLTQVNLLVGKNNCGKTALLEGIQFLTSGGDPAVLAEIAERRGEIILKRTEHPIYPGRDLISDIAHFFSGHAIADNSWFSISGNNSYHPVKVQIFADSKHSPGATGNSGQQSSSDSGLFIKISCQPKSERKEPRFAISREGGVDLEVPVSRFRRIVATRKSQGPRVRFVGPDSLNFNDMAEMWNEVTLKGHEIDVAEAMRVLEDGLESVHFLTGIYANTYFPSCAGIVVGMKGQEGRIPLGSMGDGMRRLMALATSLAVTKDGCLFVDEIDTGLHYSVMPDMWKMVIAKAAASNTQVFATTHSWDCIDGLARLCQKEPDLKSKVAIHKIDRAIPHSIPFAGESIVRMAKADIDPR